MFCKYCGRKLEDDATFCSGCGKSVANENNNSVNNLNNSSSINLDNTINVNEVKNYALRSTEVYKKEYIEALKNIENKNV